MLEGCEIVEQPLKAHLTLSTERGFYQTYLFIEHTSYQNIMILGSSQYMQGKKMFFYPMHSSESRSQILSH